MRTSVPPQCPGPPPPVPLDEEVVVDAVVPPPLLDAVPPPLPPLPAVELLALLCERYGADPPQPDTVRTWGDKYLAVFDARIAKKKKLSAE